MAALAERLPNIDFIMSMGLPEDAANETVDLAQFAAMVKGSRKPIVVSSPFGGETMRAMHEMAALCGRADSFACLTMTSPPLMVDDVAVTKSLVCGELGIPLVLAPAPSAGSTAPASLPAVIAVANAEVLAGLCIHQLACPGAPFVYGAGVGIINMRTTVEAYCSPESPLGHQAMIDLARHYGLPSWSYAADSDSKSFDEQWAAEAMASAIFGGLSRATLLHDVGYMESGLQSSCETIVLGDEIAGYVRGFMIDLAVDDESLQLEAIIAAGPGANHLGSKHTRAHYRGFWQPQLFDQNVFERWQADGARRSPSACTNARWNCSTRPGLSTSRGRLGATRRHRGRGAPRSDRGLNGGRAETAIRQRGAGCGWAAPRPAARRSCNRLLHCRPR